MENKDIVISTGDPAGCGPFISLMAVEKYKANGCNFIVVGDTIVLERIPVFRRLKNKIRVVDVSTPGIDKLIYGKSSKLSGQASLNYLKKSLEILSNTNARRLVTAPLSKEAVKYVLPVFSGHTEYLAEYFNVNNVVMMMFSKELKVVLLTRHILLRNLISSLDKKNISDNIFLIYESLKKQFKIKQPKIIVASVNPHAGIDTFIDEEETILIAAINRFKKKIYGPYPADTIFIKENIKKYDCIICPYHDQAMIPFKLFSLKSGVNVTLGLPIIRTSPAHGVAYDVIKKGNNPFSSSMVEAIKLATYLTV